MECEICGKNYFISSDLQKYSYNLHNHVITCIIYLTPIIYITHIIFRTHIIYITHMVKFIFKAYKKN